MNKRRAFAPLIACGGVVLAACCGPSTRAEEPVAGSSRVILLRHCVLEFDQSTLLSAQFPSILQERLVQFGDRVKAGQVLGRLFDQVARAEMEINAEEASSDVQIQISKTELAQAANKLRKTEALSRKKYVSEEELLTDQFAMEKAALAVKEAQHRRRIAQINQRRGEAEVRSREFVSPHDGIVVGAFKNQGESVILHDPVFKVINNDRLKVWGTLNVTDLWRVRVGQEVRVRCEVAGSDLPIEHQAFPGRIAFIDTQVDQETQTCKVLAQIDNREGQLRAGLQAIMEILPTEASRSSAAETGPPPPAPGREPSEVAVGPGRASPRPRDDAKESLIAHPPTPRLRAVESH